MELLRNYPTSRLALSLLLALLLVAFGLFGMGLRCAVHTGSPCWSGPDSSTESSANTGDKETDDTESNTPSASNEPEEGADTLVILAPDPSLELHNFEADKVVWHRLDSPDPSKVGSQPAYEPPDLA